VRRWEWGKSGGGGAAGEGVSLGGTDVVLLIVAAVAATCHEVTPAVLLEVCVRACVRACVRVCAWQIVPNKCDDVEFHLKESLERMQVRNVVLDDCFSVY
jgi:hypothetical protein